METDDKSNGLLPLLRRMASLGIESVKLTTAERLTVLCSAISIIAMLAMVLGFVLLFFSLGCVKMLSQSMSECWAYVIVGGVYAQHNCSKESAGGRSYSPIYVTTNLGE